ncbi:MAG TPA: lamin tail domain-containing protein [Methylomirabilota bacterium]|nr:lamin tail domain-containing protein [Methylomirabilota bacterium]
MPTGQGWLGGNPGGSELMQGTIYRVTVYDDVLPDDVIQRHADAYNDVVRAPIITSFTATPSTIFSPASSTLNWSVQNALGVSINGTDVTALPSLNVTPAVTTTYTLVATNAGGSSTSAVTVVVNPAPEIRSFAANKGFAGAGETITLSWGVMYGQTFSIAPGIGDVTQETVDGVGNLSLQIAATTVYTLTVGSAFGTDMATYEVKVVQPANHPVISEFMADNNSTLADEDGQFSDWIEIYNPTVAPINLSSYFLTDNKSEPTLWPFPDVSLPAGGHLLIFASGKNRVNPAAPLHTSFQLNKAGEYLALVGPGPVVLQAFDPYPPQRGDISYGVLGGDLSLVTIMGRPTPGAENDSAPPPPAKVEFSRASGFFTEPFTVSLSSATPDAVIRYTLNGSVPSATNGFDYSAPIAVNGTTRLRAVALAHGQSSELTGERFIKLAPDLANYSSTLPIMVIENFGAGVIPQKGWTGTGAGVRQVPRQDALWATFERQGDTSAFTNAPQMLSRIGIRGRGAFSSQWRQKPYSVEALDEAGGERAISPLGLPAHADWVLYFPDPDSNKDPTMLFNTFAYELYQTFGRDFAVRFRWVEAFINEDGGDLRLADRRGVYAIFEKVSRGPDRLNFTKLSVDGTTGGWLLSLNRMDPEPENGWPAENGTTVPQFFHTAGPNRILQTPPNAQVVGDDEPQQSNGYLNFDNPSGYIINTNQRAAIEGWFKEFEDVLWNNAIWRDPTNGYRRYLDAEDFADYFILNTLTHNGDGLLISMFPWKGDDGKLRMGPAWDYNWSPYYISGSPTADLLWRSDRLWYRRLFTDPDFRQLYIDRWWQHRRGAMSNAGIDAIIDRQVAEISAEKALLNGFANSNHWATNLTLLRTWLKTRADWIDSNYLRPPFFNQDGGDVPDGFQVTILGTNGTIYYTTDGSDPRLLGGAISGAAQAFQLPFALTAQTTVSARIRNGTNWSGLTRAVFYPPQDLSKLVVTEIMYNPPAFGTFTGNDLEFIELKNTGSTPLTLGTLTFTAGINFTFTNGTRLQPGEFFVLARNRAAFAAKYSEVPVNGVYSGQLDNAGETLRLSTAFGNTVLSVAYNDRTPWPLAADGHGFSAVPRVSGANPNSDNGAHWRASANSGGSPGADDPEPAILPVLVNEALTHTELPAVDWIELFNPNTSEVNIGGWLLSDDPAAPKKFRIPDGTVISPGGYRVFTEADFNASPLLVSSFSLSSIGDSIYLSAADANTNLTGYSHGVTFGAAAHGVTFGRYVNSVGEEQFPAQIAPTPHAPNSGPRIGPVVLSEIHYHPDAAGDEFIELRNLTASPVALFDPAFPTNTWRVNGLGFTLPPNVTLPAGGALLIAGVDPVAFRAKYSVAPEVVVLGPFAGTLQDSGERIELQRPDTPGTNGVPYITVDEVRYNDRAPWPPAADGSGASLQRVDLLAYGNDPANWAAAIPTPGAELAVGLAPVITSQPRNVAILSFESAQFSVSATGAAPLFYQWLFNGSLITSATNAVLTLTNVHPGQAGDYSVVVFNHAGSVASTAARLTVNRVPTILVPPADVSARPGGTATFAVSAVGNGLLRYQWRFNGADLASETNAVLTLVNVGIEHAGRYSVVVADSVGWITSQPGQLVVLVNPAIVAQPVGADVAPGADVVLSVAVTNTATLPIGYRWRRNGSSVSTNILDARSDFFVVTNVQSSNLWDVIVFNAARPGGLLSSRVSVKPVGDRDGDGLPDDWEAAHRLDPSNAADATLDGDGDEMSNGEEYLAGTDPNDPLSYLKIDSIRSDRGAAITFGARAGRTYSVQYADQMEGPWIRLADVVAPAEDRAETLVDPTSKTNRFYRLVTPRPP